MDFLADLYIHGETTYEIEEKGKLKSVTVSRTQYTLTQDALKEFERIHDSWEKDICEKNPHDALIGGDYYLCLNTLQRQLGIFQVS